MNDNWCIVEKAPGYEIGDLSSCCLLRYLAVSFWASNLLSLDLTFLSPKKRQTRSLVFIFSTQWASFSRLSLFVGTMF